MKIAIDINVNGFPVYAEYEESNIKTIFVPLLKRWSKIYREKGKRIIVFLSAPPGVGKTTLANFLEYLSREHSDLEEIQSAGLDGFHFHQDYLMTHQLKVNGKTLLMKDIKGAPETFDIEKLRQKLKALKEGPVQWPIYDRTLHDVVEDQLLLDKNIILIEGNWLLSTEGSWNDLILECDDSLFIYAPEHLLKDRLIQRKIKGGSSFEEAQRFYLNSDGKNVQRLLKNHHPGQINLMMTEDGEYYKINERGNKNEEC